MIDMKCPFCQRKLKTFAKYKDGTSTVYCSKCNLIGDSKLFSELIRTRKALEMTDTDLAIIVTTLDKVFPDMRLVFETIRSARKRIAEITALKQKDK